MESSNIRLGKIAGIPVGMSWSLVLVAGVFALGLAQSRFPSSDPGYSTGTYWMAALATVVAFFASVLAHELSHAVVARRHGLPVEGVTLWLLGGVARLGGEAPDPPAELRIAAVGPLTSGAMAVLFAGLARLSDTLGLDPLVASALSWQALINLVLAAFNALPAAPLDGGRVLAAVIWWRTHDRTRGQIGAATAGRVLGIGLLALGAWELFVWEADLGIWTAFVGWFVLQTAQAEGASARARAHLVGLTLGRVVRPDPPVVDGSVTVDGLIAMLGGSGHHTAFAVRGPDGTLHSVVTLDDIRRVSPAQRSALLVEDVAVPIADLTTAWSTEPLLQALDRTREGGRSEIVVYDEQMQLVGIIGRHDLARLASGAAHGPPPPPPRHSGSPA